MASIIRCNTYEMYMFMVLYVDLIGGSYKVQTPNCTYIYWYSPDIHAHKLATPCTN